MCHTLSLLHTKTRGKSVQPEKSTGEGTTQLIAPLLFLCSPPPLISLPLQGFLSKSPQKIAAPAATSPPIHPGGAPPEPSPRPQDRAAAAARLLMCALPLRCSPVIISRLPSPPRASRLFRSGASYLLIGSIARLFRKIGFFCGGAPRPRFLVGVSRDRGFSGGFS